MRPVLFLVVLGICVSATAYSASTEGFFEMQTSMRQGATGSMASSLTLDGYISHVFDDSAFGMSGFLLVTDGWAQGYAGPLWDPAKWLELSVSAGAEQGPHGLEPRYATSIFLEQAFFSALGILEFDNGVFSHDNSGVWYDVTAKARLASWLSLGFKGRRPVGWGPYLEAKLPALPMKIWVAWTPMDPEDTVHLHADRFLITGRLLF